MPPAAAPGLRAGEGPRGRQPLADELKPFFRAGGFWRNFKARYPESDEMYARMLGLSHRLADASAREGADPDYLEIARRSSIAASATAPTGTAPSAASICRTSATRSIASLITAHNALDDAEGRTGPARRARGRRLQSRRPPGGQARERPPDRAGPPGPGGHIYELDVRQTRDQRARNTPCRPKPIIGQSSRHPPAERDRAQADGPASIHERVILKQEGLDRLLVYDRHPRKALVDHFYPIDVTLDDLAACRDVERGDFVMGTYLRQASSATPVAWPLVMERPGQADGHTVRIRSRSRWPPARRCSKSITSFSTCRARACLHLRRRAQPRRDGRTCRRPLLFRRPRRQARRARLPLDLAHTEGIALTDEWLDLTVGLSWSRPGGLWCFPIETVSQSEGGFEGVYQSSAVVPHWHVTADETGRWDV